MRAVCIGFCIIAGERREELYRGEGGGGQCVGFVVLAGDRCEELYRGEGG